MHSTLSPHFHIIFLFIARIEVILALEVRYGWIVWSAQITKMTTNMIDQTVLDVVKEYPLPVVLSKLGIMPADRKDPAAGRKYYTYLASYRGERNHSLSIFHKNGKWLFKDHATGEYGTGLDLLVRFGFFQSWREAAEYIDSEFLHMNNAAPMPRCHNAHANPAPIHKQDTAAIISSLMRLDGSPAESYLVKVRCIPAAIADRYMRFVSYSYPGNRQKYYGMAWPTIRGGWSIRWPKDIGKGKGKAFVGPGGPSFFPSVQGQQTPSCLVFEGIMDFLSLIVLTGGEQRTDAVILNSVDNVNEAKHLLEHYNTIHCCLDNDDAGKNATKAIISAFENVVDHASEFAPHNDLNDYLKNRNAYEQH